MSDIVSGKKEAEKILTALMTIWSNYSYGWKCVQKDLSEGSAYMSVPVKTVFDSQSRFELIVRWCGHAPSSAWDDSIGKTAFYERCKMLICEEDLPLIKDYDPAKHIEHYRITNAKKDLALPLAAFIYDYLSPKEIQLNQIDRAILISASLNEKIKIPKTEQELMDWCYLNLIRIQKPGKLSQPKDSFKKLEVPGYRRITSARMLKKICENALIPYVNDLALASKSGALYTDDKHFLLVRCQAGRFIVHTYGSHGDEIENKIIKECIEGQKPFRDPRRSK